MRNSLARECIVAAALLTLVVCVGGPDVSAHRLDELLQAARIAIGPRRVEVELTMTPGVALAEAAMAEIDSNRDGALSAGEQQAYAARVLGALSLELDGRPLQMGLAASTFPGAEAFRHGEGAIRLQMGAVLPAQSPGAHALFFRNANRPDVSVYLANAVVPGSDQIAITAQHRDRDQRQLTIDYLQQSGQTRSLRVWLLVGLAAAALATKRWFNAPKSTESSAS